MIDNLLLKHLPLTLLIVTLLVGSCGTKTRTITPLSESDKSGIKKVAIHVQVDDELDATISTIKSRYYLLDLLNCTGSVACIFLIPLVVGLVLVEEAVRSDMDNKKADEFREDISNIKLDRLISERIDEYFETSDAPFEAEISEIQSPSILAQQGFDTLLDISIVGLDVKLCPKSLVYGYIADTNVGTGPLSSDDEDYRDAISRWNAIYPEYMMKSTKAANDFLYSADAARLSKKEAERIDRLVEEVEMLRPVIEKYAHNSVRMWITFKGKMISTGDSRVLWDREELYYDPKCENVEDMQNNPEIVVDMMIRALQDIAVNTVNEIQ